MSLYYEYARDISPDMPHFLIAPTRGDDLSEMMVWCNEYVGRAIVTYVPVMRAKGQSWRCFPDLGCFQFTNETDAVAFKMRWS